MIRALPFVLISFFIATLTLVPSTALAFEYLICTDPFGDPACIPSGEDDCGADRYGYPSWWSPECQVRDGCLDYPDHELCVGEPPPPPTCAAGQLGTYPDCYDPPPPPPPPPPTCAELGYDSGVFPSCWNTPPPPPTCAELGYDSGVFPSCWNTPPPPPTCAELGYSMGTFPACWNPPPPPPVCAAGTDTGVTCWTGENECGEVSWGSYVCDGAGGTLCSVSTPPPAVDQDPAPGLQCVPSDGPICTPNAACATTTCQGEVCYDACNGAAYAGLVQCVAEPVCTPDASCATSTCQGQVCYDACNGAAYAGLLDCTAPVGNLPSVTCTPEDTDNLPSGNSVTFTANPADGAGPLYTWRDGSNNIIGTGSTLTRTFTSGGSVRVQASDGAGGAVYSDYCSVSVSGGACSGSGPVDLTATPSRIQQGGSTLLEWEGMNIAATSCTVTNLNTNTPVKTTAVVASPSCAMTDSITVSNIQNQTSFQLDCGGGLTKTVVVNLVPKYEEF